MKAFVTLFDGSVPARKDVVTVDFDTWIDNNPEVHSRRDLKELLNNGFSLINSNLPVEVRFEDECSDCGKKMVDICDHGKVITTECQNNDCIRNKWESPIPIPTKTRTIPVNTPLESIADIESDNDKALIRVFRYILATLKVTPPKRLYKHNRIGDARYREALSARLDELCPPGTWFGMNESFEFGFWVEMEIVNRMVDDGEVVKLSDVPDFTNNDKEVWNGAEYACVVNDHGNCTLYDRAGNEIWSVV